MSPRFPHRSMRGAVALTLALAAAACYTPARRTVEHESEWSSSQVRRVDVRGTRGRISVEAADVDTIRLEARVRSAGRGRPDDPQKLIEAKLVGDTLQVRERRSRGRRGIFPFHFGGGPQIDFDLVVPRRVELVAETVNGRVVVEGVAGETSLSSVNGGIRVAGAGAALKASTVNGSIRAEFIDEFRGARLRTVNGSIAVEVPSDASLDLDIRQVNGSFRTDLPVVMESTGRAGTRGSLHGGKFPLQIETVNGSVRLVQSGPAGDATRG